MPAEQSREAATLALLRQLHWGGSSRRCQRIGSPQGFQALFHFAHRQVLWKQRALLIHWFLPVEWTEETAARFRWSLIRSKNWTNSHGSRRSRRTPTREHRSGNEKMWRFDADRDQHLGFPDWITFRGRV